MTRRATYDRLFASDYDTLCRIARRLHHSTTHQDPAALVHEAYLRYRRREFADDRFVYVMALAMRSVARDRRRREGALKRGGGSLPLDGTHLERIGDDSAEVADQLHDALRQLAVAHPRWLAAIAHHDLAGRSLDETARRMGIGEARVRSYRRSALRWLRTTLTR